MVAEATTDTQLVSDEVTELAVADLDVGRRPPAARRRCDDRVGADGGHGIESTLSTLELASRHRIAIADISYTKLFVSIALLEELAACCCQSVGAAWSSSSLGVPADSGPLLRLSSGLDGDNL